MLRVVSWLALLTVLVLLSPHALPAAHGQTSQVYYCWLSFADPQTSGGTAWSESISGVMVVSTTGTAVSSVVTSYPIQSLTGTRTYSTLTANWSTSVSLGSTGTDGSNNNMLLYIQNPTYASLDSRQLDTTGITFQLSSTQPLAGSSSMVSTVTIKWSNSAATYVEVSSGVVSMPSRYTSWSPQLYASLGSAVNTSSIPQCLATTTPSSLVFTYCLDCFASNYTSGDWHVQAWGIQSQSMPLGLSLSSGTHQEYSTQSLMLGVTGVRTYQQADVFYTGADYPLTSSLITGLQGLPYGDGGPDNLFSYAAPWLDGNGYTYNLYPPQPVGNFAGLYSDINFYYNGYQYFGNYREVNEPNHESVCLWEKTSYTYTPYTLGMDPQAVCESTVAPTRMWGFCAQLYGYTSASDSWGVTYSGYLETTGKPFTDLAYTGLPVYYTTLARGTRLYSNYTSGYTETANIVYMQAQGGDAGSDNLFYWPSMSPFSQISWNRNGVSWTFNHNVTEAGTGIQYGDLNIYYNERLRETNDLSGGFHEEIGCIGQFTVVPWTGVAPACPLASSIPACPSAPVTFDFCFIAYGAGNSYAVATSATITGAPFQLDYGSSGGGYREYSVVQAITGSRTYYDSSLNPTTTGISGLSSSSAGQALYSVSSAYDYTSPGALLNATGISFSLASAATVPGAASASTINLYSPAIGVYTENAGTVPAFSYARHTFLSSAGQRYCTPSYAAAGCSAPSSSLPSGSLSLTVTISSPSWSTVSANPVFGMQLMEDIAYSIGTGQLYALPLLSCASATASGSSTVVTVLISNGASNATALATATQTALATSGLTLRQSGAVATTAVSNVQLLSSSSAGCSSGSSSSSSGLTGGQIAGIVIGSVIGGLLLVAVLVFLIGRMRSQDKPMRMPPTPTSEESKRSRMEAEMTEVSGTR